MTLNSQTELLLHTIIICQTSIEYGSRIFWIKKNKNIKKKLKSYGNQPIYILSKLILIIAFDYMCTDR